MIINNKTITSIVIEGKEIIYFCIGNKLIWLAIRSCFGKGFWLNDKSWDNLDGWKNM